MAKEPITMELCAPEDALVTMDVLSVMVPGEDGVFTVCAGHTPFLSALIPGVLIATDTNSEEHYFAIHGGFAEVRDRTIRILAENYEPRDDIDAERAEAAGERAEERLRKPPEDMDWTRAQTALARAMARLSVSRKHGYL